MRIVRAVYSERGECPEREPRPRNGDYTNGQPAEKWLTERQHQIELASADSSQVISQFNSASTRLRHCRNKRHAQNGSENILTKRLRRVRGARLFAKY